MATQIKTERYDQQYSDKELVGRIGHYFSPYRKRTAVIAVTIAVMALISTGLPLGIANGIDVIIRRQSSALIVGTAVFVMGVGITVWILNWVRRRLIVRLTTDVVIDLRRDAFQAAIQQDLAFHDEFSSGRIVSRITSDTQMFGEVVILSTDVINQMSFVLILLVILVTLEWRLTLLVLGMGALVVFIAQRFRDLSRRATQQGARSVGEVNNSIQEAVTGISVAKNFHQEKKIYGEFQDVNGQAYTINVRRQLALAAIFPTLQIMTGISTAALVYFGGLSAVRGIITIAAWYLFVSTIERFWIYFNGLSSFWSQFQAGLSAVERIFALIDAQLSVNQTAQRTLPSLQGRITFKNVAFHYSEQEQVFEDFSLEIEPGESVALVGHTGAGKSSIIKILTRFYEFQKGEVFIDGHDIRTLDLRAFREQLGIISQTPFLFTGTVMDNIRYICPETPEAEIERIARSIGDGEWLKALPKGLHSEAGERGSYLSMGQRQLVALVRILAKSPSIFISDEATASIDPFTESQIQEAMGIIMKNRTSILIAHRLSTVQAVDRIIVLRQGKIIEQGNHDTLMAQSGHYAELYNTYFRHQSLDYTPSL